jgi:hypothetical protein
MRAEEQRLIFRFLQCLGQILVEKEMRRFSREMLLLSRFHASYHTNSRKCRVAQIFQGMAVLLNARSCEESTTGVTQFVTPLTIGVRRSLTWPLLFRLRPLTLRIVSTCVWAPFTTSTIQDKMMDFRKWFFFHGLSFTVKLNIWSPGKRPFAAIDVVAVPHNASILRDSSLARKITETPLYMQQVDVRHSGSEASNWDEPEQTPESNFYRHKTKAIYENKWSNKIKFS